MDNKEIISLAIKIVRGTQINFDYTKTFMENSSIYKFTNENITEYFHHLENKEKILSVIGSGNQILNSILAGTNNIDCFDISYFPEYYLFLQIASIISLDEEDYFHYYLSEDRDVMFSDYFYDKIRDNLKGKYKEFWDYLYMLDDGYDIYNSLLFRQDFYSKNQAIKYNPFLQENNYNKLKNILTTSNIEINPVVTDVITTKFSDKYNLIYLSNILNYYFNIKDIVEFMRNKYLLADEGEILGYLYSVSDDIVNKFNESLKNDGYVETVGENKILVLKKSLNTQ